MISGEPTCAPLSLSGAEVTADVCLREDQQGFSIMVATAPCKCLNRAEGETTLGLFVSTGGRQNVRQQDATSFGSKEIDRNGLEVQD